jgi:hypothetical protein
LVRYSRATVGCQIVAVTYQNKELFGILLGATATTLVTIVADSKHVGAEMGFFALLHTSGSNLLHHPELHVLELLQNLQSGDTVSPGNSFTVG